ncbi:TraQ conjugal transfer family protein [Alistipes finegoldii]|uniref:TraQ conjugal transfer family protein n=1 Tax=Alistipes finegoldii TaxID=214856 RepID=UPI003AF54833
MGIMKIITSCTFALLAGLGLAACNDKIDVKQDYDFALSCWHLPSEIVPGEQVEIRFTLTRQGDFKGAEYYIGYIQLEGKGKVTDRTDMPLVSREIYELQTVSGLDADDPYRQVFTLYYTALSDERTKLRFVVEDNFGRERKLEVSFDSERQ